jgi:hypothetical protein
MLKAAIKQLPAWGSLLPSVRAKLGTFKGSRDYWEQRYKTGGNSGAGSYNRLAEFKAEFLNRFVEEHQIASVIEFGCGDGAQLKLAKYPSYTGTDISMTALEKCRSLFVGDLSKRFLSLESLEQNNPADLSLSLDVIYHLVEDSVFDAYMRRLFSFAWRFVIIYSSNMDRDWPSKHVRHREFTRWVENNRPEWCLLSVIKNPYPFDPSNQEQTSFADFYLFARGE